MDYIQAFPQAPVEKDLYMRIPKGLEPDKGRVQDYVLKVNKNVYGQKQAGRVWNQYLVKKLKEVGFQPSKVDQCILYKGRMIYVLCTEDSILTGPDQN